MYLYIFVAFAVIYLMYYLVVRVKPTFLEWGFYLFLTVVALMPGRIQYTMWFPGQTTANNVLCIWVFLAFAVVLRIFSGRAFSRWEISVLGWTALIIAWAGVSAAASGSADFVSLCSTALGKWIPGLLACFFGLMALPRTPRAVWRLEMFYTTLSAVAIAPQLVLTALNLGDWDIASHSTYGFTRGWSTLSSGISTGIFVLPAFFLAMRRFFLQQDRTRNALFLAIIFIAVLFTLARSTMILLGIGTVLMVLRYSKRSARQVALLSFVGCAFLLAAVLGLENYSFMRFTSLGGSSSSFRMESALVALEAGAKSPVVGRGFGCLYHDIRGRQRDTVFILVDGKRSAWEPHNVYLLFWAEMGLVGVILVIGLLLCFYQPLKRSAWKAHRHRPDLTCQRIVWFIVVLFFLTGSGWIVQLNSALFFSLILLIGPVQADTLRQLSSRSTAQRGRASLANGATRRNPTAVGGA
jgi:hypothetical protein